MQVTETKTEGLTHEFKVVLSATEFDEKMDLRLKQLAGEVRLPGFRPGKAPLAILKQRYGDAVRGEVLEQALNDSSSQAMMDRGLRPAVQPKIEIDSFEDGKDIEYSMSVEVLPEIGEVDYGKLALEREVVKVDAKEVDETLGRLAEQYGTTKPINKPRAAKDGDTAIIDFVGKVGGEAFQGGSAEDYSLKLGSGAFIPGFEDQVVGARPGDDIEVKVTFPAEYGNEELAGKDAIFEVKVKSLEEAAPAEVNDELATKMGLENLDALKSQMRERIESQYAEVTREKLKRNLLDALNEQAEFPVPEGMAQMEFDAIWEQVSQDISSNSLPDEDKDKSEDDLRAEYRAIAERRVRLGLLIAEIGQQNNIQVEQSEISKGIMDEAQRYPGQERQVIEAYQNNPEMAQQLRAPIFENKVVDFILEMAKVKDKQVTVEELLAPPEEAATPKKAAPKKKAEATKDAGEKPAAKKTAAGKPAAKKPAAEKDTKK